MTYGLSALIMTINTWMCMIIVAVVGFEKRHTYNDETMVMY